MKKETTVTGNPSTFLLWGLIICACFLFFMAVFIYTAEKPQEEQTSATGFSCFLAALGLYCLFITKDIHSLTIFTDRLQVKSIWGYVVREISLDEIIGWTEIRKTRGKSPRTFLHLTLYTAKLKYQVSSESYSNYPQLKSKLIAGKPRNIEEERKWHRRDDLKHSAIFLLTGCFFLYIAFSDNKDFSFNLVFSLIYVAFFGGAVYFYLKKPQS